MSDLPTAHPRRVIPCLLMGKSGFVKTTKFDAPRYLGDAVNTVRIFNDKEADELVILDIIAGKERTPIRYDTVLEIVSEAFMPVCYGGGITSFDEIKRLLRLGVEKVALCTGALERPGLITEAANAFGNQSVVGVVEVVKKGFFGGQETSMQGGKRKTGLSPEEAAQKLVAAGAGEIMINHVERDGVMGGYDVDLVQRICRAVNVPVIACGGCGSLDHIRELFAATPVSAAAAGSLFVYHGPHRAVLINYPQPAQLRELTSR
jgi:imidazole glycerol-phosphate synthase subunit HisF